ncbi:AI-2E family transporter [Cytophagaceae bacterium ABcell3]|nr:AI-2E family transporter [Cytophagaceae bacterium ABcell3]
MEQDILKKYTLLLAFLFLFIGGLYVTRSFLIPFFAAALIAMLLLPLADFFERLGINRAVSIIFCLIGVLTLLGVLIFMTSVQIRLFADDLALYRFTIADRFFSLREFISENFQITHEEQAAYLQAELESLIVSAGAWLRSAILMTSNFLMTISIMTFYIFFFLFYRDKYQRFLLMINKQENHERTLYIIKNTTNMTKDYLAGVLIVVLVLTIVNSIGLWFMGIPHPFFLGLVAAVLNIIPFIGSVIGSVIPMVIAFLSKDSIWYVFAVGIFFVVVQLIESYVLTPNITGGKIRLNPMATIVALIIGGLLWGVAGMILFIPLLGILKVLFQHIEYLNPYAYLIGAETNDKESIIKRPGFKRWVRRFFSKWRK